MVMDEGMCQLHMSRSLLFGDQMIGGWHGGRKKGLPLEVLLRNSVVCI